MEIEEFLTPGERYLAGLIHELERTMSALTDQVDAALDALRANEADDQARVDAAESAAALLQAQVDELTAGRAVDEAELQKVLDTLNQLGISSGGSGDTTTPPTDDGTSDQPPADAGATDTGTGGDTTTPPDDGTQVQGPTDGTPPLDQPPLDADGDAATTAGT